VCTFHFFFVFFIIFSWLFFCFVFNCSNFWNFQNISLYIQYIYIFLFLFSRNFKFSEIYKLINLSFFEKLQKIKKKDKLFFKYKIQQGKENLGKESKTT
jgi:hypothetical protein